MERTYERVQLVMVQLSTIRFARRSCGRSKILCKQLILRLSVNGLKEEASPTENGWKLPRTPSRFQASHSILGRDEQWWWAPQVHLWLHRCLFRSWRLTLSCFRRWRQDGCSCCHNGSGRCCDPGTFLPCGRCRRPRCPCLSSRDAGRGRRNWLMQPIWMNMSGTLPWISFVLAPHTTLVSTWGIWRFTSRNSSIETYFRGSMVRFLIREFSILSILKTVKRFFSSSSAAPGYHTVAGSSVPEGATNTLWFS